MIEMKIVRVFTFPGCVVNADYTNNYIETVFPDGTKVPATANFRQEDIDMAEKLGYGFNTAMMTREHEILHTYLAVKMGHDYSPTLWDVAHNQNLGQGLHGSEEGNVLTFQQYLNGMELEESNDPHAVERLRQYDVEVMRIEALKLLR